MDVTSIASLATSMAETGNRQEIGIAVLKRAQDIAMASATQLLEALPAPQSAKLPAHLGNTINTRA